jgi:hypothetical protein
MEKNEITTGAAPAAPAVLFAVTKIRLRLATFAVTGASTLLYRGHRGKIEFGYIKRAKSGAVRMVHPEAPSRRRPGQDADDREWLDAILHKHPDGGYGFPGLAFKHAMVEALIRHPELAAITAEQARGAFHPADEYVPIIGEPTLHMSTPKGGTLDGKLPPAAVRKRAAAKPGSVIRRAKFSAWSATVRLSYNGEIVYPHELLVMLNAAGREIGVGDYRVFVGGKCGRFSADEADDHDDDTVTL